MTDDGESCAEEGLIWGEDLRYGFEGALFNVDHRCISVVMNDHRAIAILDVEVVNCSHWVKF